MKSPSQNEIVDEDVGLQISASLARIESEHEVAILLAVESGSRAWGFASPDSDYDVRFLYVHRPEWYLSVDGEHRRDVIEVPIDDRLDVSGWELRKALKLFARSNPALLEWLQCGIVYRERGSAAEWLRRRLPECFSPRASFGHYFSMAKGNRSRHLSGETAQLKKYLYVLRPLLALRWLERGRGPVPIEFDRLVQATCDDPVLLAAIGDLLAWKRHAVEHAAAPRLPTLDRFIDTELEKFQGLSDRFPHRAPEPAELDRVFRGSLLELWGPPGAWELGRHGGPAGR